MEEITEAQFESNFDYYMNLIENEKKEYIIRLPDGKAVAALPFPNDISLDMVENVEYDDLASMVNHDDTSHIA
jgi:hypothetical protein